MFRLEPEFYTVKDVARVLQVTPRAVQIAYKRTGKIAGVAFNRTEHSQIRIPRSKYREILRAIQFM